MFNMFEDYCHGLDIHIATKHAFKGVSNETNFGDYIQVLIKSRQLEAEKRDLEEQLHTLMDEVNWYVISGGAQDVVDDHYTPAINDLEEQTNNINEDLDKLDKEKLLKGVGPCTKSLDVTLKGLGVERQAYHGKSFVGNHCHKLLFVSGH